jgi:uncharacterized protein (TIGR02996 family)
MSDEAAFLDALAANPADDTARLVYADWLDEHGEPAKAEYLRLVVALARAETDYAREQPDVARTLALAEALPADWRAAAGSRFKLVFSGVDEASQKVAAINRIREVGGQGLAAAASILELPPGRILSCVPFEHGFSGREHIHEIESATAQVHACDGDSLPSAVTYEIVAQRTWRSGPPIQPVSEEFIAVLSEFLNSALCSVPENVREMIASYGVVLETGVELSAARSRVAELRRKRPPGSDSPVWHLSVRFFAIATGPSSPR